MYLIKFDLGYLVNNSDNIYFEKDKNKATKYTSEDIENYEDSIVANIRKLYPHILYQGVIEIED